MTLGDPSPSTYDHRWRSNLNSLFKYRVREYRVRAAHSIKAVQRRVFRFLFLVSGIFKEGGRNFNEHPDKSESPERQVSKVWQSA